jgi:hypothetical protein
MLYSLVLFVFAVVFILQFIFFSPTGFGNPTRENLANGLSILLIAAPLWVYNWRVIERSLESSAEYNSLFRLVVLYLLTWAGDHHIVQRGLGIAVILRVLLDREAITVGPVQPVEFHSRPGHSHGGDLGVFRSGMASNHQPGFGSIAKSRSQAVLFLYPGALGNIAVFFACQQLFGVLIDQILGQSTGWHPILIRSATPWPCL